MTTTTATLAVPTADVTGRLIERVRAALANVGDDDLRLARQCLVDWSGVLLNAAVSEYRTSATGWAPTGEGATDLVHGRQVAASGAAQVNGMFSHILDFDDVHLDVPGHTGVATIPAALAVAEEVDADLHLLSLGIIAGVEAMAWLGRAMAPGHHAAGWHPTATLGAIGAAVSAAIIRGFDDARLRSTIGFAAVQASGLQQAFGGEGKSWQVGCAARNGVDAAAAVAAGLECPDDLLGGPCGLIVTYGGSLDGVDRAARPATAPAAIRDTIFKMHASCFSTHAAIEASAVLGERDGVTPDQVEHFTVRTGPGFAHIVANRAPRTALEAKFSATATVAMPLLGITTVRPDAFSEELVAHPGLVALEARGELIADADVADNAAVVTMTLRSGELVSAAADCPAPSADLVEQGLRLHEKFRQLTAFAADQNPVERFLSLVGDGADGQTPAREVVAELNRVSSQGR